MAELVPGAIIGTEPCPGCGKPITWRLNKGGGASAVCPHGCRYRAHHGKDTAAQLWAAHHPDPEPEDTEYGPETQPQIPDDPGDDGGGSPDTGGDDARNFWE